MGAMAQKMTMPTSAEILPGRATQMAVKNRHAVNGNPIKEPFADGLQKVVFGMGCFWGAERRFWLQPGVFSTHVGYAGGTTPNPVYTEVCTGKTGHTEVVRVVYDPRITGFDNLLRVFWESHDPTQGMRQGNDMGTEYRSVLYYYTPEQQELAHASRHAYQEELTKHGYGTITTEVEKAGEFYYAEEFHQQYLHKVPDGYCGLAGSGVSCPVGLKGKKKANDEL